MSGAAYLFAGGGTGGHIFPALAIAEELRARDPGARCVFLCSSRALDSEILTREGVEFERLPAMPLSARPLGLLKFVRSWGPSVRAVRRAIARERSARGGRAVQVIAMGGFVAAPAARAAAAERVPLMLVNLDAAPGKANRWMARKAQRIVTSLPACGYDWERVPPIVRKAALAVGDARACRVALGIDAERPTLLVTGASQGARSINRLLIRLTIDDPRAFDGWQVIHQTGAGEDGAVREAYGAARIPALVRPFFEGMGNCWGAADFAVSRAGAGSVAEAWANHTPTIFMPYPYHRDQHQRHNAQPLAEAGGADIRDDLVEEARNALVAGGRILELLKSEAIRRAMRGAFERLGPADGAGRIAAMLLENRA